MRLVGSLRVGFVLLLCAGVLAIAGPSSAEDGGFAPTDTDSVPFGADPTADSNFFGPFIAFGLLVVLVGIGTTIWKVSTARNLAREAGMDPDVATGMTLLDEDGLTTAYLASSLRTAMPAESTPPSVSSATQRLTELKSLLDGGLISQAEYDERRKAIIDSV